MSRHCSDAGTDASKIFPRVSRCRLFIEGMIAHYAIILKWKTVIRRDRSGLCSDSRRFGCHRGRAVRGMALCLLLREAKVGKRAGTHVNG